MTDDLAEAKRHIESVSVNMNHNVRVKLTARGKEILEQQNALWNSRFPTLAIAREIPEDGVYLTPLWDLMNTFGAYLYNGCTVPFETEMAIAIEAPAELTQPEHDRTVRLATLEEAAQFIIAVASEDDDSETGNRASDAFNAMTGEPMNSRLRVWNGVIADGIRSLIDQTGGEGGI